MKAEIRQKVYDKFNGKCAYTGWPLPFDWQVDHVYSKYHHKIGIVFGNPEDIDNLMPALKIVNHYKRAKNIETFRAYISTLHLRLKRYKNNQYIQKVASHFGITPETPFDGKFYFEKVK